ncbi:DUF1600 domain-containing protein [[Mycoplasma] imitans]|uniref:DUF1600 domain-containing protein n=1 Tax=[Mycoplasma] imitans TaxID=29560 RepID=UPI000487B527|nr:DUF1600 domain-containing protein [[Mycoplasma] imitans]
MTNKKERFCGIKWYKSKLTKSQKLLFVVLLVNTIGLGFVVFNFVDSLSTNTFGSTFINGFTAIGSFNNQTSVLLFIFSFVYVFAPKSTLLRNEKFLIFSMAYTLFNLFTGDIVDGLVEQAKGTITLKPAVVASGIFLQIINPIIFFVCGFFRFIYNPIKDFHKFSSFLFYGMIYPIIYLIYVLTIPLVYHSPDKEIYSVYGIYSNTINNTATAIVIGLILTFVYYPASFYFIILFARGFNNRHYRIAQRKAAIAAGH